MPAIVPDVEFAPGVSTWPVAVWCGNRVGPAQLHVILDAREALNVNQYRARGVLRARARLLKGSTPEPGAVSPGDPVNYLP
jgi:hypothetical protein